jgi:hypothetical protein
MANCAISYHVLATPEGFKSPRSDSTKRFGEVRPIGVSPPDLSGLLLFGRVELGSAAGVGGSGRQATVRNLP